MAALSQTPASVTSDKWSQAYTAGGTITQGMPVYLDSTDSNKAKAADNTTEAAAEAIGIAQCAASSGQPVILSTNGADVNLGATLIVGDDYYVGAAGAIDNATDLLTGEYVTHLGTAISVTEIRQQIVATGATHA